MFQHVGYHIYIFYYINFIFNYSVCHMSIIQPILNPIVGW